MKADPPVTESDLPVHNLLPMATTTVTICDVPIGRGNVCGALVEQPVTVDGQELDICAEHAEPITSLVALLTAPPRPARPRKRKRPPTGRRPGNAEIREWAAKRGIDLNPRGRIPNDIVARYERAQARRKPAADD